MKVLLITDTPSEISYQDWESTLEREGVPFDTVITSSNPALPPLSTTGAGGVQIANYEGVVVATSGLEGLTPAQWATLQTYEHQFSVRQVTAYVYPSQDYGLTTPAGGMPLAGTTPLSLTGDGGKTFPYLKAVSLDSTGTYGYQATRLAGANVDTLISGPGSGSMVGIYTAPDGRQIMYQTFDENQYMLQSELLRGRGLGERLLECAFAAGLAGDRQLRGPDGDAAGERFGALAARDLDWCALTELGEQSGAVLLRRFLERDRRSVELEEFHLHLRARSGKPRDRDGAVAGNSDDRRLGHRPRQVADAATGPQCPAQRACPLGIDPDTCAAAEFLDRAVERSGVAGPTLDRDLTHAGQDRAEQLVLPHRGLRQRPDLPAGLRCDSGRHGVPIAVVVTDEQQRSL